MATRVRPIASAQVFNVAQGDPLMSDRGFGVTDILHKTHKTGSSTRKSAGQPHLQWIDGLGLTNRLYLTPVDMRLSQYTVTPSASWDEVQSIGGLKPVYHLRQFSAAPGVVYSAQSNNNLAANPTFAVSLIIPDSPHNWDYATMEPYTRITFGGGLFAVYIGKNSGSFLAANVGGVWQLLKEVSRGHGSASSHYHTDELWVWIRCEGGGIYVSTDFGQNWEGIGPNEEGGSSFSVPSGKWGVDGQGGQVAVGLGELIPSTGTYTPQTSNTFVNRSALASPVITGTVIATPAGVGGVTYTDASAPASGIACYNLTITPGQTQTFPFRMWQCPVVQEVTLRYPFQRVTTAGTYSTPWDSSILGVSVRKPRKLSDASCSITFSASAQVPVTDNYRWRKMRVRLGYLMSDNTRQLTNVFTGYVKSITRHWSEIWGQVVTTVELVNIAYMLKRFKWDPTMRVYLGGMTPQAAGDFILKSEGFMDEAGFDGTYRNWFSASLGTPPMPFGRYDEPFEMTKTGEAKWAQMERIFDYYGFELAVDDDGVIVSVPNNYVSSTIDWKLSANDTGLTPTEFEDIRRQMKSIRHTMNSEDCATAVCAYGKVVNDQECVAWAIDAVAETDATNERFSPFRDLHIEEMSGYLTPGMIVGKAQYTARDMFGIRRDADATFSVNPFLSRRSGIAIYGCAGVGIPDGTKYALMTHDIDYKAEGDLASLESKAGLWRA